MNDVSPDATFPPSDERACRRAALALILAFAAARILLAYALGFGIDEAYTAVISRRLDLSYFDHPPLHQWLAHYAAQLMGEGPSMRLPFIALFAGTGWLMFVLTMRLFGPRAGVWAVFALNAAAFFFVSAGGWIVPDGPLLFALAAAAIIFVKLFFDAPDSGAIWRLWLAGGFWLGLAGLSKYSAVFFAFGLLAFMALSPRQRRWFVHPAPYVAALLCVVVVSPVIIWNIENHWVSFAFQGGRGAPGAHWRPLQVAQMALGEVAWLTPWIFVPLVGALIAAARLARFDERRLLLLCLSAPSIVLFSLTPLWGAKGLPHWPMPGWFFAYPLLGVWFSDGWARRFNLRAWAFASAALLGAIAIILVSHAATGWLLKVLALPHGVVDPTLEALNWNNLAKSSLLDPHGASPPAFVVSTKWSEGGKIALALGPDMPISVYSDDPRGMAFLDESASLVGKDAVIIVPKARLASVTPIFQPFFASLGPPQNVALGRSGADEIDLALIPAHGLTRAFPLPYPR
jgi:4-amino-4-deoxy-L-arabinose transferase-like glycosyltransferase